VEPAAAKASDLLIEHGPIGILALALAFGVYMLWRENRRLIVQIGEIQAARITERDKIVAALIESTNAIKEVLEAGLSRRRT